MQNEDLEYLEATKAAQVQFAIYLLTPAMNSHIRQTFPDHIAMDFADCCQIFLSLSATHGRTGRFFRMPPSLDTEWPIGTQILSGSGTVIRLNT